MVFLILVIITIDFNEEFEILTQNLKSFFFWRTFPPSLVDELAGWLAGWLSQNRRILSDRDKKLIPRAWWIASLAQHTFKPVLVQHPFAPIRKEKSFISVGSHFSFLEKKKNFLSSLREEKLSWSLLGRKRILLKKKRLFPGSHFRRSTDLVVELDT